MTTSPVPSHCLTKAVPSRFGNPRSELTPTSHRIGPVDGSVRQRAPAAGRAEPGLSKDHIPSRPVATLVTYRGGSLLKLRLQTPRLHEPPPKRGEVSAFTEPSRRRFLHLLASLRREAEPVFVTLTYPDSFPTYSADYKRHLELFSQRLRRRWPEMALIWKLEFQTRKSGENQGKIAPHYHLILYGVPLRFPFRKELRPAYRHECIQPPALGGDRYWITWYYGAEPNVTAAGNRRLGQFCWSKETNEAGELVENLDDLKHWVSRTWYDVVASGDAKHYRAGTKVEAIRSFQQLCGYAAKRYLSKKEVVPTLEHKPGRFWGVIGREHLPGAEPEEVQLTEKQAFQLRRCFRRYRRAITPPEKRRRLKFGLNDPREFSVSLFADASFWRARLWALVGDEPDAYELPEHRSALAELLRTMAATGYRFHVDAPNWRQRPKTPSAGLDGPTSPPSAGSWLAAAHPEP